MTNRVVPIYVRRVGCNNCLAGSPACVANYVITLRPFSRIRLWQPYANIAMLIVHKSRRAFFAMLIILVFTFLFFLSTKKIIELRFFSGFMVHAKNRTDNCLFLAFPGCRDETDRRQFR